MLTNRSFWRKKRYEIFFCITNIKKNYKKKAYQYICKGLIWAKNHQKLYNKGNLKKQSLQKKIVIKMPRFSYLIFIKIFLKFQNMWKWTEEFLHYKKL